MIIGARSESSKTFFRDLGLLLHVPAYLTIPSIIVLIYFQEYYALPSFIIMAVVSVVSGQVLYRTFKENKESKSRFTLLLVALAWLLIPLMGSIPFYGISFLNENNIGEAVVFNNPASAIFEAMSGFTSTGLSMLDRPDTIPHVLQWWRSLSEWLGGVGVIILAVGVFDFSSRKGMLYEAEAMSWTIGEGELTDTIKKIWVIYIGLTIATITAFYLAGMPGWEAINHGLTGVSTGGFSINEDSFISYNSTIKWIAIVVMIIGALSFQIHYLFFFKGALKKISRLSEIKLFSVILLGLMVLVNILNPSQNLVDNVFQTSSALGTCGFNSVETPNMPVPILFLFIIAMTLGGNASSTTGGLKTRRIIWIFKGVFKSVRETGKEKNDDKDYYVFYNEQKIKEKKAKEQIKNAANIFVLWLSAISIGSFIIILTEGDDYLFHQILFDVSSALNNVGLSAGVNGNDMTNTSKGVFIVLMWIGRLEIFACMVLIYSILSFKLFK